jgi:signal transduction histidine kinase
MEDFVSSRNLSLVYAQSHMISHLIEDKVIDPDGRNLDAWIDNFSLDMPPVVVVDGKGMTLAHPDKEKIGQHLADFPGSQYVLSQTTGSKIVSSDGTDYIVTFTLVQDTDWRVIITESVDSVIGPTLRLSKLGPILTLIAVAVSLFIIGFNWRTILRPIQILSGAADQVNWRSYPQIPFPEESVQEIEALHRALVAMIARIKEYEVGIRSYLGATTQGQEEERARIAREIHDGPVQEIIALGQRLDMIRDSLLRDSEQGECSEEVSFLLNEMRGTQIETIEGLRRIVNDLRPVYLEDLGFLPALEMLVQQANLRGGVNVEMRSDGIIQRLPIDLELIAYRIAQEALNNALQHADAETVIIEVSCFKDGLRLVVSDDGSGFTPPDRLETLTYSGRYGLLGIHERVSQQDGKLQLESGPDKGTRLTVHLPGCQAVN